MDEHVLRTVFRLDETETLCRIEKLNRTDGHVASPCQIATSRAPEVTLQGFFGECRLKCPSARQPIAKANNSARFDGSYRAENQSFSRRCHDLRNRLMQRDPILF
jgi:hypothetical protein